MTANGILQIALYFLVLLALTKPLGTFMAKVFSGERTFLHPVLRPLEVGLYKLCGIQEDGEQHWTIYAGSMLAFSLVGIVFSYHAAALAAMVAAEPAGARQTWVRTCRSTPPSASARTPTGNRTHPKRP
jgi:K+-transporting ATPase ATPase A chain